MTHEWIADADALAAFIAQAPTSAPIALDTEFMRTDTFAPVLALTQVRIGERSALLDSPRLGAHAALGARLADPANLCVMHSASEDLEALLAIAPRGPARLFDTQIAAALCGIGYGLSYQKLVGALLGIDLPKSETRSNWLQRPLSAAQLDYAAQDVAHLPQIHALLAERLAALGRADWLAQDCTALIARVCQPVPDAQPQRAFRNASAWPRENQALLRRLLLWRERAARRYDKPRSWLLDDARTLDLAERPPSTLDALAERTRGLRALRSAQRQEVFDLLRAPPDAQDRDAEPIPPPFDGPAKRTLGAMKEAVAAIAAQLNLPEGLLCPRRHLETLLTSRVWPAALEGWRRPLLHEALMALLP